MGLNRNDLGQLKDNSRYILRNAVRRVDRCAFGQIDDHGQLGFVVKWQQLDGHILCVEQAERSK